MNSPRSLFEFTDAGEPRGYIDPHSLDELWFHTGTACNLSCPFCFEGSKPGDNRLQRVTLSDVKPFMDEAVDAGVRQFSFTGGEPFIVKDFVNILRYAADRLPCLVLTNGTEPVLKRMEQIATLANSPNPISFRISIDYADAKQHDAGRGTGSFAQSLQAMKALRELGFNVSLARQQGADENTPSVDAVFRAMLDEHELDTETRIVSFPDFDLPTTSPNVPDVTEDCMTRHQNEATRREFMCAFSKMVIKKDNQMRVYACTLVDDDENYDQGGSLSEAMQQRVMLKHHRCYTCFRYGSSCSEI